MDGAQTFCLLKDSQLLLVFDDEATITTCMCVFKSVQ